MHCLFDFDVCKYNPVLSNLIRLVFEACPKAATLTNKQGKTVLHYCCWGGHYLAVKLFIENIPSLCFIANKRGLFPFDCHSENESRNPKIDELLELASVSVIADLIQSNQKMPLELFHHVAETIANVLVTTPPPTLAELNASVDWLQFENCT